jgi:hypothetical protein
LWHGREELFIAVMGESERVIWSLEEKVAGGGAVRPDPESYFSISISIWISISKIDPFSRMCG